jgi:hypothetical protein
MLFDVLNVGVFGTPPQFIGFLDEDVEPSKLLVSGECCLSLLISKPVHVPDGCDERFQ